MNDKIEKIVNCILENKPMLYNGRVILPYQLNSDFILVRTINFDKDLLLEDGFEISLVDKNIDFITDVNLII